MFESIWWTSSLKGIFPYLTITEPTAFGTTLDIGPESQLSSGWPTPYKSYKTEEENDKNHSPLHTFWTLHLPKATLRTHRTRQTRQQTMTTTVRVQCTAHHICTQQKCIAHGIAHTYAGLIVMFIQPGVPPTPPSLVTNHFTVNRPVATYHQRVLELSPRTPPPQFATHISAQTAAAFQFKPFPGPLFTIHTRSPNCVCMHNYCKVKDARCVSF